MNTIEQPAATPAEFSGRPAMKPARSAECAPVNPRSGPADQPQSGTIQLRVEGSEFPGVASYRHWGINE
jgi:hypothetical protein